MWMLRCLEPFHVGPALLSRPVLLEMNEHGAIWLSMQLLVDLRCILQEPPLLEDQHLARSQLLLLAHEQLMGAWHASED